MVELQREPTTASQLGIDIAINAKLVTDVRLGYFRYNINTSKYDQGIALATQLGIPGMNTGDPITGGAPSFQLAEVGSSTEPRAFQSTEPGTAVWRWSERDRCNCPLIEKEDQYQFVNNWTKVLGNHSIKFGADLRYARNLRVPSDNDRTGILYFSNQPTSNPNITTGRRAASASRLSLSEGDRLQALRQHINEREGVPETRLLLCAGHLANYAEADRELWSALRVLLPRDDQFCRARRLA